jgi:uncharacterized protein
MRHGVGAIFLAWLLSLSACQSAPHKMATEPLLIKSAQGKVETFTVEVARTKAEQDRGLMFRDTLAKNRGMIFPLDPPHTGSFWMKDTLVSLDMLFIRSDGTIAQIAAETVPESRTPIVSGEPVAAVLEIAGGEAAKRGIAEGDVVQWGILGK